MTLLKVFRHVPPPIIGSCGVYQDRVFAEFEAELDWIEAAGTPVERLDPGSVPAEVECRVPVRELLLAEGDRCLPLILAGDRIVSQGVYLTRTQLAHLVAILHREETLARGPAAVKL